MDSVGLLPDRVMDLPICKLNAPVPVAVWVTLLAVWVVLGLMITPAVFPVALRWAFTLTLFDAVNVKVWLEVQLTSALILMSPDPSVAPAALCSSTFEVAKLV